METEVVQIFGEQGTDLRTLVLSADVVVRTIMLLLVLASVWSWAVIFEKFFLFGRLRRKADRFENAFWSGRPLDELYRKMNAGQKNHPMARLFIVAMDEWKHSAEPGGGSGVLSPGVSERVDRVMKVTLARDLENVSRNLGILATVGSTAPFAGLFGTVWGIMNSFQAIALSQDTGLSVVAPGIAEALFATALGLFAAVPAVVGYNCHSSALNSYAVRLEGFADEFSSILARRISSGVR